MMRSRKIFFCAFTALGLGVVGAQVPVPSTLVTPLCLNHFLETWDAHLDGLELASLHEWKLRERLTRHPIDTASLDGLIEHFQANRERTLHAAALQYAARSGATNFTTNLTNFHDEVHLVMDIDARGQLEGDAFIEARLDLVRDRLSKTDTHAISLSEYSRMESELRSMLVKSELQKDILIVLSDYYHHRRDWCMSAMVTMLVLRIEPGHTGMIDRCLTVLARPGYEHMQQLMLQFYVKQKLSNLSQLKQFISLCDDFGLKDEALAFRKQAIRLEPENAGHWAYLGRHCLDRRDYVRAFKFLMQAVKLPDHDATVYLDLARISAYEGDIPSTALWLERWRPHISEDQLLVALLRDPLRRYPRLLRELE